MTILAGEPTIATGAAIIATFAVFEKKRADVLRVVDGFSPKGIEDDGEIQWRKDFVRQIGYKR